MTILNQQGGVYTNKFTKKLKRYSRRKTKIKRALRINATVTTEIRWVNTGNSFRNKSRFCFLIHILDARVAPKFYWNMKCSDYGWEELTNETIRFTCNEVKLVIDRADYIVENVGKPLWIEYIRRTHPTSCTIYVDWNPTKLQGLHLTYIIEKLPEIGNSEINSQRLIIQVLKFQRKIFTNFSTSNHIIPRLETMSSILVTTSARTSQPK